MASEARGRSGSEVVWIPDEEVHECPICSRKFSTTTRKHHCRACGRVICSSCSSNQLVLPNQGPKEQRVCDVCYDSLRHDKVATMSEEQLQMKQVQSSLKADLKEKIHQAKSFRAFLLKVCPAGHGSQTLAAAASAVGSESPTSGDGDEASSSSSPGPAQSSDPKDAELESQLAAARIRWSEICQEVATRSQATEKLLSECEELDRVVQDKRLDIEKVGKAIRDMKQDLVRRPQIEAERDEFHRKADALREELEGLTQRMQSLENQNTMRSDSFLSTGSFLSLGSPAASFNQVAGDGTDNCADRVRNLRCNLM